MTQIDETKGYGCPKCRSYAVRRSQVSGFGEHIKRLLTRKRPFRCLQCHWRGWLDDYNYSFVGQDKLTIDPDYQKKMDAGKADAEKRVRE